MLGLGCWKRTFVCPVCFAAPPMSTEAAPRSLPRSFVDYQLARSAQTRHALGTLHADQNLAKGTDELARHLVRAPARPTAWSSGQETVLPWHEMEVRRKAAVLDIQRFARGRKIRNLQAQLDLAIAVEKQESMEFEEHMRAVGRAKKMREGAALQVQRVRRGFQARKAIVSANSCKKMVP